MRSTSTEDYESLSADYGTRSFELSPRIEKQIARADRLLELGCSMGHLTAHLRRLAGARALVVGCDLSTGSVRKASSNYPGIAFLGADATRLPFGRATFQIAVSSNLVEHLEEVTDHLTEVLRVVRPGGYYVIRTPNAFVDKPYWAYDRFRRQREAGAGLPEALRRSRYAGRGGHCSVQTHRSLRRLAEECGWRFVENVRQTRPTNMEAEKLRRLRLEWIVRRTLRWWPLQCQFSVVTALERPE